MFTSPFEVLFRLLGEDVCDVAVKAEADSVAHGVVLLHVERRDDDDDVLALGGDVQMHGGAHHFAHVDLRCDALAGSFDDRMLRTDAERHGLGLYVVFKQARFFLRAQLYALSAELDEELLILAHELRIEEVHLRRTDKARDEEVARIVEHLLRSTDLLDVAVAHDDYSVAEGHGLGLVMGDVYKGGIDTFAQLDYLGTHLVAQLCVEVGERFIHQEDGGITHNRAADGDALALAAGQSLGLAVKVLGDIEDLRGLADLLVDNVLALLAQLQREGHVLIDGHVRVQGVVLENHRDIPVLGRDVVHQLAVDVKLTLGDLLKTRDHSQRRGLAAAGGADQNDELLIGDVKAELLHRDNALLGYLELGLAFLFLVVLLLFLLVLSAYERVDFFDVSQ